MIERSNKRYVYVESKTNMESESEMKKHKLIALNLKNEIKNTVDGDSLSLFMQIIIIMVLFVVGCSSIVVRCTF